jgi:hypothetical protein
LANSRALFRSPFIFQFPAISIRAITLIPYPFFGF